MTAQELKIAILQLAVHGKLVQQNLDDEPGSELLKKIKAKMDQQIKDGKLKKEKPFVPITQDERQFDYPENWAVVRFGSVISLLSGADLPSDMYNDQRAGIPYITGASNIENYSVLINRWTEHPNNIAHNGDILLTCKGTVGKTAILHESEAHIARQVMAITPFLLNTMYVQIFVESNVEVLKRKAKSLIPGIDRNNVLNLCFPIPPLAEQERIVEKVEELMPLVEEYGKAEEQLTALNAEFPDKLRKSILQQAIQGKLTERDPADEPAAELLKRIRAEKEKLIKEGKTRKENPFPPITEDELPFEMPNGWLAARIGDVGVYKKGPFGSSITKNMFIPKGPDAIKVYEQKNAIQKDHTLGEYYIRRSYFEEKMRGFEVFPGDVIVSCAGTIGETYVMPEGIEQGIINQALMRMKIVQSLNLDYFLLYFDYVLKKSAQGDSKGSAIKNIPPFEVFKRMILPIPPLAEQKRIVDRVNELLAMCDELK